MCSEDGLDGRTDGFGDLSVIHDVGHVEQAQEGLV